MSLHGEENVAELLSNCFVGFLENLRKHKDILRLTYINPEQKILKNCFEVHIF